MFMPTFATALRARFERLGEREERGPALLEVKPARFRDWLSGVAFPSAPAEVAAVARFLGVREADVRLLCEQTRAEYAHARRYGREAERSGLGIVRVGRFLGDVTAEALGDAEPPVELDPILTRTVRIPDAESDFAASLPGVVSVSSDGPALRVICDSHESAVAVRDAAWEAFFEPEGPEDL